MEKKKKLFLNRDKSDPYGTKYLYFCDKPRNIVHKNKPQVII